MKTRISILYSLISIVSLQASEQKPCYLALMPIEILDRIAFFIPFPYYETDDEFIARTQRSDSVPFEVFGTHKRILNSKACIVEYSAHKTKFILIEKAGSGLSHGTMQIIDMKQQASAYTQQLFSITSIAGIAVSDKKDMFAYIEGQENLTVQYYFSVNNMLINQQNFIIKPCLCHSDSPVAFNKQETHIIVHHKNVLTLQRDKCVVTGKHSHTIFPLISSENIATSTRKKILQEYFSKRVVCKLFSSILQ